MGRVDSNKKNDPLERMRESILFVSKTACYKTSWPEDWLFFCRWDANREGADTGELIIDEDRPHLRVKMSAGRTTVFCLKKQPLSAGSAKLVNTDIIRSKASKKNKVETEDEATEVKIKKKRIQGK